MKVKEVIKSSVAKSLSVKSVRYLFVLLVIIILSWTAVSCAQLVIDSAVIITNSDTLLSDASAVKVEDIEEDGTLRLSDTTSVLSEDIEEYSRTAWGTDTYYIPEGIMAAPLTLQDSIIYAVRYVILSWVSFCLILYISSRCKRLLTLRLTMLLQIIFVVADMFCMYLYSTLYYYKDENIANNVLYVFVALAIVRLLMYTMYCSQCTKKIKTQSQVAQIED